MAIQHKIVVAEGDGIGPEIMAAVLHVLQASGANLDITKVEIGEKVYLAGEPTGIAPETWEVIRGADAFLKAPITTPQGGGFKSLNVTIRTMLGLYANVRPCVAYAPFVATQHPGMDVVIVRENEEDLYTGIEYRQSQSSYHALKVMSQPGCEKIIRYAFDYAVAHGRQKVTCFTKDNILKLSDGLFHKVFDAVAAEYPDIENEHWIIDIGTAKLADTPTAFDVIVMPNLYGDILSDVAAQIAGSVGLAGSANIGLDAAMFEAIHGSAPRLAGQNSANPSGLLLAAVMMLAHLGETERAAAIHNAWMKTIEEGIHTDDIFKAGVSNTRVDTRQFAEAVATRLGQQPQQLKVATYGDTAISCTQISSPPTTTKQMVGVDLFVEWTGTAAELHSKVTAAASPTLSLTMIANRGARVWPVQLPETFCIDSWRCRFMADEKLSHYEIAALLEALANAGVDFVHIETLCTFNGEPGYTVAQDEQ